MSRLLDEFLILFKPKVEGSGFQKLNKQLKHTHDNLFNIGNLMRAFIGFDLYSGIKNFAGSMVQSAKDLGAMESRFYAILKSEKLANEELEWAFKLAKKTAMPLKSVADSYSIFFASAQKSMGTGGAREVFEGWTKVARVLHLSEYQFERVTYALRELTSKGAIYSQDLRMQLGTHVPDAMGMTKEAVMKLYKETAGKMGIFGGDWFEQFQKKAKGNQQFINEFLKLFTEVAVKSYASSNAMKNAMKQVDAQLVTLSNTWQELQYSIVKAGFSEDLTKGLMALNSVLGSATKHAKVIYNILKGILTIVTVMITLWGSSKIIAGILWLIPKVIWLFGYISTIVSMIAQGWGVLATIGLVLGDIIALLGGPLTVAVATIITLTAIIIFNWGKIKKFIVDASVACKNWFGQAILAIKLIGATIYGEILLKLQKVKDFWNWFTSRIGGRSNQTSTNNFSGVKPNKRTWDYTKNQNLLTPLSRVTKTSSGNNTNISPIIYNTNNISANGLSEVQVASLIDEANDRNNYKLMSSIKTGIKNSKNTYS